MADVNANIGVGIDTSDALSQLKALQRQISQFHSSIVKSSEAAAAAQRNLQKNFINSVNAIGAFSAELRTVRTSAESFTNSLEKNKFSMREYFRYAAASTKTFGKNFGSEFSTIEKVATERVKTLQTQFIKMGRDANGAMQAIAIRPTVLDMKDLGTQSAIAAQKQAIFNQLLKQGSTNLLNFGKNTQWAGRQLMVGFTLPLVTLGTTAAKTFMEMEAQVIKFKKVYGDLFTPAAEREQALKEIQALAAAFTQYGIAASDTVGVASEAAAAGFQGVDLQRQTEQALRLSVLGQLDYQKSLETTISLQNAFRMSSGDLGESINFLNAVENQTVVSLDDITTAIPKVAPVIQSLGGDVKDLAFFLAAMKEGGVNASEGANALKSGLASLINPTEKAAAFLGTFGINLKAIVRENEGDLKGIVIGFAQALDRLNPTQRAQAIEQLFGKFQFARLSTLFDNVIRDSNQASRVLDLAGASVEDLASMADKELGQTADSAMNKFLKTVEDLKIALAPIGEIFLQVFTPFVEFVGNIAEGFNNLPDGIKKAITSIIAIIGGLGPVALMTFGLINNGIANAIKFIAMLRNGYAGLTGNSSLLTEQTQYMSTEQLEAAAAAASLDQTHSKLIQTFNVEAAAVNQLRQAYEQAVIAGTKFASMNPNLIAKGGAPGKFASGGIIPGSGNKDTVPIMATPGEFVVKKDVAQQMLPFLQALNSGKLPGFNDGGQVGGRKSGKLMTLPGGAELAHFSDPVNMLGKDLIALAKAAAEAGKATRAQLQAVIDGVGDNLEGMFKVFDARVERLSAELNQMVGDAGSGKTAPKSLVQRDLVERAGDARLPLIDRLRRQGVSPEDALAKADKVTAEIASALNLLGDDVLLTAEDINEITQKAYKAVADIDDEVAKAYATMSELSSFKDESGDRGSKGQRTAITKDSYIPQKGRVRTLAGKVEGGTAYGASGFKTTEEMASIAGMTEVEIQKMFKALPSQVKLAVFDQLKNGTASFISALLEAAETGTVQGVKDSTKQASPSKEAYDAGRNIGIGAIQGIESVVEDGSVQQSAAKSTRQSKRAGTGGENLVWDEKASNYKTQSKMAAQEASRQAGIQREYSRKLTENITRLGEFSSKIQSTSLAVSGIAGVLTMFGGEIGNVAGMILQVTLAFSALATVTSALTKSQLASKAVDIGTGLFSLSKRGGGAGLTKGAGLFGNIKNVVSSVIGPLGTVGKFFLRMVPILGGVLLAFEAFKFVSGIIEEQKKKITGLGDTAYLTAEKMKKAGELLGFTPSGGLNLATGITQVQGVGGAELNKAEEIRKSENFTTDFADQINAIKGATMAEAEAALNSMIVQLISQGATPEAAQALATAIATEAGKTKVNLSFGVKFDPKDPQSLATLASTAKAGAAAFATTFQSEFEKNNGVTNALKTQGNTLAGQISSTLTGLKAGFDQGTLSATEFNAKVAEVTGGLKGLSADALNIVVPALAKDLGLEESLDGLKDMQSQIVIIEALLAGVEVSPEMIKQMKELSKSTNPADKKKLLGLQNQLIAATKKEVQVQEDLNKSKEADLAVTQAAAEYEAGLEDLNAKIKALQDEATAYSILTTNGFSAAEATKAVADANFAAALAAATNKAEQDALILKYKEMQALAAASPVVRSSGGGGKKSAFQEAKDSLKAQRDEIKNNITAYNKLRAAGLGVKAAFEAAGDPQIAAAIAKTKPGTAKWKELISLIKQTNIQAKKLEKLELSIKIQTDFSGFLDDMVGKANEYFDILERDVERNYRDRIKKEQDAIKKVEKEIEGLQKDVAAKERTIELTYDRPIAVLQEESSDLANDLTIIDQKSKAINEKYDAQKQALEDVRKINQDIINQQKSQISLADALSQGDISAAAGLMQDMRGQAAAAASGSVGTALDAARQSQLAGLTGKSGLTRDQIEARQYEIGQQIYALEEKKEIILGEIQVIQDNIYKLETGALQTAKDRLTKLEEEKGKQLEVIDAQRQKWEDARLAQDLAKIKAGEYNDVLKMGKLLVGDIVKNWKDIKDKTVKLFIQEVRVPAGGSTGGSSSSSSSTRSTTSTSSSTANSAAAAAALRKLQSSGSNSLNATERKLLNMAPVKKMYGGIVKKMAFGGVVGGTGMGDVVPAMLTPGEFVVNKASTKKFMPMLKSMNDGKFPGMGRPIAPSFMREPRDVQVPSIESTTNTSISATNSANAVYNYNLSVNVKGSSANADAIANTVISKIKQMDAQRVRGKVIS